MGRARILVIDDERAVRELISDALAIEGHDVHTAENGKEALDLIGQNRYDLVFCDLRMPEMDGQRLYEEVQRNYPQVLKRIVFVTAHEGRVWIEEMTGGGTAFVVELPLVGTEAP